MVTFRKLGKFGRLGNQLFQFSGAWLYGHLNGFKTAFPEWPGCEIFENIKCYSIFERLIARFLPTRQLADVKSYKKTDMLKFLIGINKNLPQTIDIEELHRNPKDNVNLYGYLQDHFSLELLHKHKRQILSLFKFRREIDDSCRMAAQKYYPWIAVHIRRGDFVNLGRTMPVADYKKFLDEIRGDNNVYVASDDRNMAAEFSEFNPFKISNPPPKIADFVFDFWMLSHAKAVIGGGSTFSWWAAYLGNQNQYYSPPLSHLWEDLGREVQKIDI